MKLSFEQILRDLIMEDVIRNPEVFNANLTIDQIVEHKMELFVHNLYESYKENLFLKIKGES